MKSTILLATGLFLVTAPAPDAQDIAEMTANFIVPNSVDGLLVADERAAEPARPDRASLPRADAAAAPGTTPGADAAKPAD